MRISKNEPKTRAAVEKYREENDMSYIGDQMRAAYLKSRGRTIDREQQNEESREEYAADRVTDSAETLGRETVYYGQRTVNYAKHNYSKGVCSSSVNISFLIFCCAEVRKYSPLRKRGVELNGDTR